MSWPWDLLGSKLEIISLVSSLANSTFVEVFSLESRSSFETSVPLSIMEYYFSIRELKSSELKSSVLFLESVIFIYYHELLGE